MAFLEAMAASLGELISHNESLDRGLRRVCWGDPRNAHRIRNYVLASGIVDPGQDACFC